MIRVTAVTGDAYRCVVHPHLEIVAVRTSGIATVALRGELDVATAGAVESHLDGLADDRTIRLDLADLTFVDSSGISMLLQLHRRLGVQLRSLELVNVQGQPRMVLEMTGFSELFGIEERPV